MSMARLLFLALLPLAGCGFRAGTKQSDSRDTTVQTFAQKVPEVASEPAREQRPVARVEPRDEIHSNNATKTDVGVIGVQVLKLAEKVQGFGGDMLRLETKVENAITIHSAVQTRLNAELEAKITARFDALAQVQAGIGNKIEQQTINSGRDTTQFTKHMAEMIEKKDSTIYWIVGSAIGAIISVVGSLVTVIGLFLKMLREKEASRERADKREAELRGTLLKGKVNEKS